MQWYAVIKWILNLFLQKPFFTLHSEMKAYKNVTVVDKPCYMEYLIGKNFRERDFGNV